MISNKKTGVVCFICNSSLLQYSTFDKYAHNAYKYFITAHELTNRLEQAGLINKGGRNHDKLVHADGRATVVHRHKRDIPFGTLKSIEKQTMVKLT
ncbi:type II toxin-antitoxin system HicA family toxin [Desulfosarcina sp. OttesenSCG-928-B08]|nr:type II toxin-antitoxin system HicA family toxin [Desulfosarcina sp. OttesenSCG-928-B08]